MLNFGLLATLVVINYIFSIDFYQSPCNKVFFYNPLRHEALLQLKELEARSWISVNTSAVFVELTIYNAATNFIR